MLIQFHSDCADDNVQAVVVSGPFVASPVVVVVVIVVGVLTVL